MARMVVAVAGRVGAIAVVGTLRRGAVAAGSAWVAVAVLAGAAGRVVVPGNVLDGTADIDAVPDWDGLGAGTGALTSRRVPSGVSFVGRA